jgi:glycosyltransferase involved in cell wall biosynthesis
LKDARATILGGHWFALTGVKPEDTHFTVIIPVHNEQGALPSVLGALLSSVIPCAADVQIIFVVNASEDDSAKIIRDRLARFGVPVDLALAPSAWDPTRTNEAFQVLLGSMRFIVVETPTGGKANALNLGNEIALQSGHKIAVNIDANNWIEPDSLAWMFEHANRVIIENPESDVVLINSREFSQANNDRDPDTSREKTLKAEVTGWMFAWSTQWIRENNGFPQYAIEDYGTGLLALSQKKKIEESHANVWGYSAANLGDENKEQIRYIYGALQLKDRFKNDADATRILLGDFPILRSWKDRLTYGLLRRQNWARPVKFLRGLARWALNEALIFQARIKYWRNPLGQTWEPVASTKKARSSSS